MKIENWRDLSFAYIEANKNNKGIDTIGSKKFVAVENLIKGAIEVKESFPEAAMSIWKSLMDLGLEPKVKDEHSINKAGDLR